MQGHEGDRGRAIRVGNDAAVAFHILAVDFGNDEWHLGHHAEGRGVVDHNRATIHSGLGVVAGNSTAGAEKSDVDVAEGVERERFDGVSFATKFEGSTRRTGRGEEAEAGEIVAVNEQVRDNPALANTDPQGDGWFFKMKLVHPEELDTLMDEGTYVMFLQNT
jgi:hypothetical protein